MPVFLHLFLSEKKFINHEDYINSTEKTDVLVDTYYTGVPGMIEYCTQKCDKKLLHESIDLFVKVPGENSILYQELGATYSFSYNSSGNEATARIRFFLSLNRSEILSPCLWELRAMVEP